MSGKVVSLEPRLRARADLARGAGPLGFGDVVEHLDAQRFRTISISVSGGDPSVVAVVLAGRFETRFDVGRDGAGFGAVLEICVAGAKVVIGQDTFEMAQLFSDGSLMVVHAVGVLLLIEFDESRAGHPAPVA